MLECAQQQQQQHVHPISNPNPDPNPNPNPNPHPNPNTTDTHAHTHILVCLNCSVQRRARTAMDDRCPPDAGVVGNDIANVGEKTDDEEDDC